MGAALLEEWLCTINFNYLKKNEKQELKNMEKKKIECLYRLLERAESEHDTETVAALRWAILQLENK